MKSQSPLYRHMGVPGRFLTGFAIGLGGKGAATAQTESASTSSPSKINSSTSAYSPVDIGIGSAATAVSSQILVSSNAIGQTDLIVNQFQGAGNILDLQQGGVTRFTLNHLGNTGIGAIPIASTGQLFSPIHFTYCRFCAVEKGNNTDSSCTKFPIHLRDHKNPESQAASTGMGLPPGFAGIGWAAGLRRGQ